jgi:hypothetical protein
LQRRRGCTIRQDREKLSGRAEFVESFTAANDQAKEAALPKAKQLSLWQLRDETSKSE